MTKQPNNQWDLGNKSMVIDVLYPPYFIFDMHLINATVYLVVNYTIQLIDTINRVSLLTSAQAT